MGLKKRLELVLVFSLLKQQPCEPEVKRMCPKGPSHEKKVEGGWRMLWEPQRVAIHPTFILVKLEGVFWVESTMCSEGKGLGTGVINVKWIQAFKW